MRLRTSLAAGLALVAVCAGGDVDAGGFTAIATIPWEDSSGFTPLVLQLRGVEHLPVRRSAAGERSLEIYIQGSGGSTVTERIRLPPSGDLRRTFLIPPGAFYVDELTLRLAPHKARVVAVNNASTAMLNFSAPALVEFLPELTTAIDTSRSSTQWSPMWNLSTTPQSIEVSELPDVWQGWLPCPMFALDDENEALLTPAQRAAMESWIRHGGHLLIVGDSAEARVSSWRSRATSTRGTVNAFVPDDPDYHQALGAWVRDLHIAAADSQKRISVPGTERIPVAGFVLVVFLFALLAGPVNLIYLRRRNRMALLLVTTPILSAASVVLLLVYNVMAEGIDTKRAYQQLTLLDIADKRATTYTVASYFSAFGEDRMPMDPDGLAMSGESWDRREQLFNNRAQFDLRTRGGVTEVAGPWIPARRHRQLVFESRRAERRRLSLDLEDGVVFVTNGLGQTLKRFCWWERTPATESIRCAAEPVPEGGRVRLALVELVDSKNPNTLGMRLYLPQHATRAFEQRKYGGGFFQAELEESFLPMPGPNATDAGPPNVVVAGRLELERPNAPAPELELEAVREEANTP